MAYHAINEGSSIPVYWQSSCASDSHCGTIYNGEVFTFVKEHNGYFGNYEIRFLNSNGGYTTGFINEGKYGNLVYSGTKVTESALGSSACYRFKLRKSLTVVSSSGNYKTTLNAGDYVYTRSATAGESNKSNMHIVGYKKGASSITSYTGFVTLDYSSGSMYSKNFCLQKG